MISSTASRWSDDQNKKENCFFTLRKHWSIWLHSYLLVRNVKWKSEQMIECNNNNQRQHHHERRCLEDWLHGCFFLYIKEIFFLSVYLNGLYHEITLEIQQSKQNNEQKNQEENDELKTKYRNVYLKLQIERISMNILFFLPLFVLD